MIVGDCIEVMRSMPADSIDAVVTDPPYGLGFMGKDWDSTFDPDTLARRVGQRDALGPEHWARKGRSKPRSQSAYQAWCELWAVEALRVLKPGGHMVVFGGTRTYHRLTAGIEDAGFEIRDCLVWLFGSGFPKSRNLEGEWEGWGTALKPGHEPIVLARKPPGCSVAENVLIHGTGALNIDASRLDPTGVTIDRDGEASRERRYKEHGATDFTGGAGLRQDPRGRWPSNVALDEVAADMLDGQSGEVGSVVKRVQRSNHVADSGDTVGWNGEKNAPTSYGDGGGASRFFYVAKASRAERNAGLGEDFQERELVWSNGEESPGTFQSDGTERAQRNFHPTVKPIDLMRYLVRLVTPPQGTILDPFAGSGTTGIAAHLEGFDFIGIERERDYARIAEARIAYFRRFPPGIDTRRVSKPVARPAGQTELFAS